MPETVGIVRESAENIKSLQWRSRRGLLELDLLLVPFAHQCLPGLSAGERSRYSRLLDEEDPDLLAWFRSGEAPDPQIHALVRRVLDFCRHDD